jgi:hypothetical protein
MLTRCNSSRRPEPGVWHEVLRLVRRQRLVTTRTKCGEPTLLTNSAAVAILPPGVRECAIY